MKLTDYKGYQINVSDFSGEFSIEGTSDYFNTLAEAKGKVDALIKSEQTKGFPMSAIFSYNMTSVRITSYNSEEKKVWLTNSTGGRRKEPITDWHGRPYFFAVNKNNQVIVKEYHALTAEIKALEKKLEALPSKLTESIVFGAH